MVLAGDGVADPRLADVLHTGDQIADLADPDAGALDRLGADHPDLQHLVHDPVGHHLDPVAVGEVSVEDPDVGDHAAVGVVDRVEDQRASRGVGVADGRGRHLDDLVEQGLDAETGLGRGPQYVAGLAADDAGELRGVLLGVRRRQVDLVEHRDDVEVGTQREVEVGQGLRLDALRRIDEEYGGLARLEGTRHLVGEVDVPGGVDHVEDVGAGLGALLVVGRHGPGHPDGLALDGDAALALDVHPVEVLRPRAPLVDDAGQLQHPVGQRRLAVVDVGDDAEVANDRGIRLPRLRRGSGCGWRHEGLSGGRWETRQFSHSAGGPPASPSAVAGGRGWRADAGRC